MDHTRLDGISKVLARRKLSRRQTLATGSACLDAGAAGDTNVAVLKLFEPTSDVATHTATHRVKGLEARWMLDNRSELRTAWVLAPKANAAGARALSKSDDGLSAA